MIQAERCLSVIITLTISEINVEVCTQKMIFDDTLVVSNTDYPIIVGLEITAISNGNKITAQSAPKIIMAFKTP